MSVVKRQNVCFGVKYTDNAGQEKTRWITVGKAFHNDRGGISIKFDAFPAGMWDGWVQLFDEKEPGQNQGGQGYNRQGAGMGGYPQPGYTAQNYPPQAYPQQTAVSPYGQEGGGIQLNNQFMPGAPAQGVTMPAPGADNPEDLPF